MPYTGAVVSVSGKKIYKTIKNMHENIKFRGKKNQIFFFILFFKNLKNADCDALLQDFVNEIQ